MRSQQPTTLFTAGALGIALFLATLPAGAQNSKSRTQAPRQEAPKPLLAWAPKPARPAPYVVPNRPIWTLSDILKQHAGQKDWTQTIVKTPQFIGEYISMGPGEKTQTVFYADDRVMWVIEAGQIRFNIQGQQPFVASKGFLVQVPFRVPYSMETVGDTPSLRFEVRPAGQEPIYPISETPQLVPGVKYVEATYTGHGEYDAINHPFLDFYKDVVHGKHSGRFVQDDHTGMGVIRGPGVLTPPPKNFGHFHESFDEFWFILEGHLDFLIEGEPLIHAAQGDIVMAPRGRWHRATNASTGMSTRLPFIARTGDGLPGVGNLHFFQPK
jgi:mannose-6-phosphate isomerase-like protein (cupin superfamily)